MKTTERRALGRGLGALLPSSRPGMSDSEFVDCPLDQIQVAEHQPRQRFDESKLRELADSIRTRGLVQPVVVYREGDVYRLIAGERRVRAARLAGLRSIPAVVKDVSPSEVFELALVENIQREDLDAIEEAQAYERLMESRGYGHDELARRVGKDRSTIANSLRLLQLDEETRGLVADGRLSAGHGRALLAIAEDEGRRRLQAAILSEGLSVREAERRARTGRSGEERPKRRRGAGRAPAPLSQLHEIIASEIGAQLEAPVRVTPTSRRAGRILIEYDSLETLRRIHQLITGQSED